MSGDDPDWKERYRKDPTTKAIVDAILDKHPEINGNPWLAQDIIKGFVQGTKALHNQMEQMSQMMHLSTAASGMGSFIHDSIQMDIQEAHAKQIKTAFTLPKPEPVTPDRLLAALVKQPELLLAVKDLMLDVRVVGPWVEFNDSDYSKMRKVSFPKGTLVRFTPHRGNKSGVEPVVKALKRFKPRLNNRHQMDEDWEWEEEIKDHEDRVDEWEHHPFGWRIEMLFHPMFPMDGREGSAATLEDAMRDADEVLQTAGWVLVDP